MKVAPVFFIVSLVLLVNCLTIFSDHDNTHPRLRTKEEGKSLNLQERKKLTQRSKVKNKQKRKSNKSQKLRRKRRKKNRNLIKNKKLRQKKKSANTKKNKAKIGEKIRNKNEKKKTNSEKNWNMKKQRSRKNAKKDKTKNKKNVWNKIGKNKTNFKKRRNKKKHKQSKNTKNYQIIRKQKGEDQNITTCDCTCEAFKDYKKALDYKKKIAKTAKFLKQLEKKSKTTSGPVKHFMDLLEKAIDESTCTSDSSKKKVESAYKQVQSCSETIPNMCSFQDISISEAEECIKSTPSSFVNYITCTNPPNANLCECYKSINPQFPDNCKAIFDRSLDVINTRKLCLNALVNGTFLHCMQFIKGEVPIIMKECLQQRGRPAPSTTPTFDVVSETEGSTTTTPKTTSTNTTTATCVCAETEGTTRNPRPPRPSRPRPTTTTATFETEGDGATRPPRPPRPPRPRPTTPTTTTTTTTSFETEGDGATRPPRPPRPPRPTPTETPTTTGVSYNVDSETQGPPRPSPPTTTTATYEGSESVTVPTPSSISSATLPTSGPATCRCGVKKSTRIVGGTEVNPKNKYPWMVALIDGRGNPLSRYCGGTLVASKYVITAAHCMFYNGDPKKPVPKSDVKVRIGDHDIFDKGETLIEKTVAVANIFKHEKYYTTVDFHEINDICVLELEEELDIDIYTPSCLAMTSDIDTFNGMIAQVYGWGSLWCGGHLPDKLMEVSVPVVNNTQCATSMGPMDPGRICAGGEEGKDSCQGDSGGPLSYERNGQHILIGAVSYGIGCAEKGYYGVYARISHYRTWIEKQMSSPRFCGGTANAVTPATKSTKTASSSTTSSSTKTVSGTTRTTVSTTTSFTTTSIKTSSKSTTTTTTSTITSSTTTTTSSTTSSAYKNTTDFSGSLKCRCGVKKSTRIVGGSEVNPKNEYPWMVALIDGSGDPPSQSTFCGGTLVASKYVITAAHCMFYNGDPKKPVPKSDVKVRIGDHDLATTGETTIAEKNIGVVNISNHENYSEAADGSHINDISVLELEEELDINIYTPACLAQTSDNDVFNGKIAKVYGWGRVSTNGAFSDELLEVSVPVVNNTYCAKSMKQPIEKGHICAGETGKDACQGDSGGPLSYESNGQHILIGVVSYSGDLDGKCDEAGYFGVYARTSFYRKWIEEKISSPRFCGETANAES